MSPVINRVVVINIIVINMDITGRVERKSVLQTAICASRSWHVLAHKSFQLAPKPFLIGRIDYNPSVI